ncbi:ABC transporter permease [Gluconacetobacter sacchari DSM 12717]|uniref:ABC transporter permease n=2 Tax=Gluconacetobacter sacchari TaxID=92759 RepID=A0A7W4IF70_9PROT|nr:ABC transporter permease [Gluconacetobacter sacchari]MBB2161765.1 ABC transporter permease [Gluconacetobacter sacchari]GBQ20062.1 ABC transporter permease [Gluconacetobacter sacchari DSM 12717]
MTSGLLRRVATLPFMLLAVASLIFAIMHALPGSMIESLSAQFVSDAQRVRLMAGLGLDQPLWRQYLVYLNSLAHFDFGISAQTGKSVATMIGETLPVTMEMAGASFVVMTVCGLGAALIAVHAADGPADVAIRLLSIILSTLPWFWLGLVLIMIFSLWLGWLPSFGRLPPSIDYRPVTNFVMIDAVILGRPDLIGPWISHLVLPSLTVGLTSSGVVMRLVRSEILATMKKEFVLTARMKGIGANRIFLRHILRNAAVGIMTVLGAQFGAMLGGSVVAEVVFGYPGIGRMLVRAIESRDYLTVQGAGIAIAALYILVNFMTDLACLYANPRLRDGVWS